MTCDGRWVPNQEPACGDRWHSDPEAHVRPDLIAERHWEPPSEDRAGSWMRVAGRWHVCGQWCKKVRVVEKEEI